MDHAQPDLALTQLSAAKQRWAETDLNQRIAVLEQIKTHLMEVADDWVARAAEAKGIAPTSPLVGEEWFSGPYALMTGCNALLETLRQMPGKAFLDAIPLRTLTTGQIAARVMPASIWDKLLLPGVKAEVWMQPGVTRDTLADSVATAYDIPPQQRIGKLALVLGAGNIASIAPLDCFHRLFSRHQVVMLKLNPVNEYLAEFLETALKPLIDLDALRIVKGDAALGQYLCNHDLVEEIHITGSQASHDAIVWGSGETGRKNKQAGTPINTRPITSELGAVGPTVVVPGPWSAADLRFQAEHIASQKLHNSGFNCIACQMLILPGEWGQTDALLSELAAVIADLEPRPAYYPGAAQRMEQFADHSTRAQQWPRGTAPACVMVPYREGDDDWFTQTEVFAPALSTHRISGTDAADYLRTAIRFANERLHGTLGANIIIHPKTIKQIGAKRFESLIADLHYGCIGINAWSGLGFSLSQTPWGAFPGHSLTDVQSGIGFVHNSYMFDRAQRTVLRAPFRPFPRSVLAGEFTLMPRPPWFVTHKTQAPLGRRMTRLQYRPKLSQLPRLMRLALRG
ncbi:MAG: aldehyde dehydrogenase [Rhodobacterales bacterium]|nr:MAG: aldehyde dehydrogenase [Rhodobacterales bacterium]